MRKHIENLQSRLADPDIDPAAAARLQEHLTRLEEAEARRSVGTAPTWEERVAARAARNPDGAADKKLAAAIRKRDEAQAEIDRLTS